jgi:uncharacterized protein Yka (UPF0111/DUF47 family)
MITVSIPLRQITVYQLDDGRRIEEFRKIGAIEEQIDETKEQVPQFTDLSSIYVGVVHVQTPIGPKEIKFEIDNVANINEAFSRYIELAHEAIKSLQDRLKQQARQIQTAPAGAIQALERAQQQGGLVVP